MNYTLPKIHCGHPFLIADYSFQHILLYHSTLPLEHRESNLQRLPTLQKQQFSFLLNSHLQYHESVFLPFSLHQQ